MNIGVVVRDNHVLSAYYLARTHQNRLSQMICRLDCLILSVNGLTRCLFHI